ncbi:hypothetical protein [Rhodococcus sovatensis]|uniref:Glycosyltransferase subfamily 4-like N-terminal domain-containing protein n=1 Tax=Rhodococcus sovatensis TaxID=1805840 RepID=A0ABZ2PCB0_9NOCA
MTVASVPTAHAYVAHLDPVGGSRSVMRLPDPVPPGADGTGRWWPPRWLDPEWLSAHTNRFDVLHLHFGFDSLSVEQLEDVVRVLDSAGKPLIFTVHDLHNPHFVDNTVHTSHLDLLVAAADELITLTPGAAQEIAARWDRRATVLPHPHVAPLHLIGRPRGESPTFVVGVHMKSLRSNLDPLAVIDTVVDTIAELPDSTVRIDIDFEVLSEGGPDSARIEAVLEHYRSVPGVAVRVHPRFTDAELWQYLTEIDVSVLPYRFGTHSGWLEACHDLGTAAVVPDCGYFSDQRPCHTFGFGIDRFDPTGLSSSLRHAHAARFDTPAATREARERERTDIASAHEGIYARALARRFGMAGASR